MSIETRQFQEMVRVAYHALSRENRDGQRKPVKAECQAVISVIVAEANGGRCPVCGDELMARSIGGKVVYYVHRFATRKKKGGCGGSY